MNNKTLYKIEKSYSNYISTGITLRKKIIKSSGKVAHLNKEEMVKQSLKLHTKIKKVAPVFTHASIEKDIDKFNRYHSHMLIYHHPTFDFTDIMMKYIGGTKWVKYIDVNYDTYTCNGTYGEITLFQTISNAHYLNYINKESLSYTWV